MKNQSHKLLSVYFKGTPRHLRALNEYGYHIIRNVSQNNYEARVTSEEQFAASLKKLGVLTYRVDQIDEDQ